MTRSKLSVLTILSLLIISMTATNPAMASSIVADSDLPYTYEFAQRFIVAGERVLNLTIANNSSRHIEALEFEARLLDAFGDVISDWSTFSNPDLKISSGSSGSLTLTLSRKNILGVNIENVLDKARSFELRYTRILLDDGTLLRMDEIYPNTEKLYGGFRIELDMLNQKTIEDKTNYNFERVSYSYESELRKYIDSTKSAWARDKFESVATLSDLVDPLEERTMILLAKVTNVSDRPIRKDWESFFSPVFVLLDDAKNQYAKFAALYAPHSMGSISYNDLLPGVTLTMVYLFDKFDGYNPKTIEAYIDGEKYVETFEVYTR